MTTLMSITIRVNAVRKPIVSTVLCHQDFSEYFMDYSSQFFPELDKMSNTNEDNVH